MNRKLKRVSQGICYVLYVIIAKHLPSLKNNHADLFTRIRYLIVKGYIDSCGRNVNIQPNAVIARRVKIGDYSGVGRDSVIMGGTTIGSHVMMGPCVYIFTQNHNFSRLDIPMDQQGWKEEEPVVIGNDVWIGSRVTILPGVNVGDGSIIGASAVVTKDVPPFSVVAGNPARVVRNRE